MSLRPKPSYHRERFIVPSTLYDGISSGKILHPPTKIDHLFFSNPAPQKLHPPSVSTTCTQKADDAYTLLPFLKKTASTCKDDSRRFRAERMSPLPDGGVVYGDVLHHTFNRSRFLNP